MKVLFRILTWTIQFDRIAGSIWLLVNLDTVQLNFHWNCTYSTRGSVDFPWKGATEITFRGAMISANSYECWELQVFKRSRIRAAFPMVLNDMHEGSHSLRPRLSTLTIEFDSQGCRLQTSSEYTHSSGVFLIEKKSQTQELEARWNYSRGQAKSTNKNKVFRRCPKTIGIDCK